MAGANLNGIKKVFGHGALDKIKTCEFHFKENRNKKAQKLDPESRPIFKEKCEALLHAQTLQGYNVAKGELQFFIDERPDRHFLDSWLKWWNDRREFIFNAFTPEDGPHMNQAEVIHAGWAHRDRPNLSLLEAARMDIRDSVLLEADLKGFMSGNSRGGTGPRYQERNYRREIDLAQKLGGEIQEMGAMIDETSGHRPPEINEHKGRSKHRRENGKKARTDKSSNQARMERASSKNGHVLSAHDEQEVPLPNQPNIAHSSSFQTGGQFMQPALALPRAAPPPVPPAARPAAPPPVPPAARFPFMLPFAVNPRVAPGTWHSGMSPYQYNLVPLPTNARKCYGCGNEFVEKFRQPPHNMVVKHVDRRLMRRDPTTGSFVYSADFTNTYYHPSFAHIQKKIRCLLDSFTSNQKFIGTLILYK